MFTPPPGKSHVSHRAPVICYFYFPLSHDYRASTERSFHSQEENRCDTETARTFGDNWLRQDENHSCHRFTARCAAGGALPVFNGS